MQIAHYKLEIANRTKAGKVLKELADKAGLKFEKEDNFYVSLVPKQQTPLPKP